MEESERRRRGGGNPGSLRDVSWRKSRRYSTLVEEDRRRETLVKGRYQPLCRYTMIFGLLQRARGANRLDGVWLPVILRYHGDAMLVP